MKSIFTAIFFLIIIFPVFARDVTITVLDHDLELPLEGAVLRTRDGIEYICDSNGKAVINVSSTPLLILALYPGYETGYLTIPASGDSFSISLRLSGVLHGRELVVEASRPGSNETRTGRSVAVNTREISQTGEIGLIEDVMNTIKLLPGVNYSGAFNAQPSIRGGHPGEMSAQLNGYYIVNPYFWGGGFSIFDPRMVKSAQLSHGVFTTRYGHTISGLLEVTTKDPSPDQTMFELGLNSSAANFNFSVPLFNKGGILFMGRVTYYDPIIELAKELSKSFPDLSAVDFIRKAPYIRTTTINGNYRFTDNLELNATGFWGMDGVSVYYLNSSNTDKLKSDTTLDFDFFNYQGFITTTFLWHPTSNILFKFTAGTGYEDRKISGQMANNISEKKFSDSFLYNPEYSDFLGILSNPFGNPFISDPYNFENAMHINQSELNYNLQGRLDFDLMASERILFSAGIQEMFNWYKTTGSQGIDNDTWFNELDIEERNRIKDTLFFIPSNSDIWNNLIVTIPLNYSPDVENYLFSTSGYILGDYRSLNNRFKAELGLRIDHFFLTGKGFSLSSDPALNPRLNIDLNLLKKTGIFESIDFTIGTGLFSSINDNVFIAERRYEITKIKPNRSWTSILGLKFEFPQRLSLNVEGYFKYIYDRMYIPITPTLDDLNISPKSDGEGFAWGIDLMLHKVQSRYWDGWLSYSFNWTKYRDPHGGNGRGFSGGDSGSSWYFPQFHRFHNLNLVFNYKPIQKMNIYVRFGFASGTPLLRRIGDSPVSYPVFLYGQDRIIEKYYWHTYQDESNRTSPSFPLDIKYSIFGSNKNGRTRYEVYVAIENLLAFVYTAEGNTNFNRYTGEINTGSTSATYDMPIPLPSFGFKISY